MGLQKFRSPLFECQKLAILSLRQHFIHTAMEFRLHMIAPLFQENLAIVCNLKSIAVQTSQLSKRKISGVFFQETWDKILGIKPHFSTILCIKFEILTKKKLLLLSWKHGRKKRQRRSVFLKILSSCFEQNGNAESQSHSFQSSNFLFDREPARSQECLCSCYTITLLQNRVVS